MNKHTGIFVAYTSFVVSAYLAIVAATVKHNAETPADDLLGRALWIAFGITVVVGFCAVAEVSSRWYGANGERQSKPS